MKAALLFTASGPLAIITSYKSITSSQLLERLKGKGIDKFIAYELPIAMVKERYGGHFNQVMYNLQETDDLRVLDYNGQRAFKLFRFKELGEPILHEPDV